MFVFAVGSHHNCASTHIHAAPHGQTALNRVAQRTPISVIHESEQFTNSMAGRVVTIRPNYRFGREIHVVDAPVVVCRDDAFRDRFQRVLRLPLAAR